MDSLANVLARLSWTAAEIVGVWERHLPARHLNAATEGRSSPSRWGRADGFPILYLGSPTDSVIVEAYRHLVDPVEDPDIVNHLAPRVLVKCRVNVSHVLDLRAARARVGLDLPHEVLQSATSDVVAYERCRTVAAAAHQQGFRGLVAPAATRMGETLALFPARALRLPNPGGGRPRAMADVAARPTFGEPTAPARRQGVARHRQPQPLTLEGVPPSTFSR